MKVIELLGVLHYDEKVVPKVQHDCHVFAQGIYNDYAGGYDLITEPQYEAFEDYIYDMEVKEVSVMEDFEPRKIKIVVEV